MKLALTCAAALTIALAACSQNSPPAATGTVAPPAGHAMAPHMNRMAGGAMHMPMMSLNGSGESGTVTLTPVGKTTRVSIMLTHEPRGAKQPAHIHEGSCAQLNPAPKWALPDVVNGTSTKIVNVSAQDLHAAAYAVNVHESAANLKKYVSCGNIK